jgi:hypothetical protein
MAFAIGNPQLHSVIAADLEAVRTPTVALIRHNTAVVPPRSTPPAWRLSNKPWSFIARSTLL